MGLVCPDISIIYAGVSALQGVSYPDIIVSIYAGMTVLSCFFMFIARTNLPIDTCGKL